MVYVDVNQVKAGMASSLDDSKCSAMAARLDAWRLREAKASFEEFHAARSGEFELSVEHLNDIYSDAWLAPISDDGPLMTETVLAAREAKASVAIAERSETEANGDCRPRECEDTNTAHQTGVDHTKRNEAEATDAGRIDAINRSVYLRYFGAGRRRASDNPILAMSFTQYREIVEWVVEQTVTPVEPLKDIPAPFAQCLPVCRTDPNHWLRAVDQFSAWFGRAVGSAQSLQGILERTGNRWIRGMRSCRATFG